MLEIGLLGPLEVRVDGRRVEVRRRKQRALLAVLALHPGEAVSPDRLVDEVWGETAPKTARHALENYVSDLRKALGHELIRTTPAGYVLEVPREHVDAERFEHLLTQARHASDERRLELLDEALALLRGPPLADLAFEPFAQVVVPRLQELELVAREERAEAALELGHDASVVLDLEPLVAQHPYRERTRALLMLALYRSGRQADALAAYQSARHVLVEELGIDPGEQLQELERAILRQDPSLTGPARREAPAREHPASPSSAPARKLVAVLAVELANASTVAAALDPEQLRAVLDRVEAACTSAVESHGGLSQKAGLPLLAVFGYPQAHEDDALRATRAAAELRDRIGALNDGLLPEHGFFLELRAAVTSGEVLVTPGAADLATGAPIDQARALAGIAQSGQILLGPSLLGFLRDAVVTEEVAATADAPPAFRLVELQPDSHGRVLQLDSPLVGRRRQLASLGAAFEAAVADRSLHLFTVLGDAGVGKSRLALEFSDGAADVARVLHGRCPPYGAAPFDPVVEALAGAGRTGQAEDGPEHLRAALERLALDRPLVVVLDDLHWAEAALLDLLDDLVATSRDVPILLLCLARPELVEARPGWGGGKPNVSAVLLEPLNEAESERLVDNLLGDSDLPDALRDHVIRTAEGNPLFVEELLATLVDRKVLTRQSGRWTTTATAAVPVPETIQALIASRIDLLPPDERETLELASIGEERVFARDDVEAIAPDGLDADACLSALVRKELVRPVAGDPAHFSFRHDLVREAAYASLPMRTRAELHDRLAGRFDAVPDSRSLARHHRERAEHWRRRLTGAVGRTDTG